MFYGDLKNNYGEKLSIMNIADRFTQIARIHQQKVAVKYPRRTGNKYNYDVITFGELESFANKYANGLSQIGFNRGSKTLLFVRPSLQFPALVFALFKLGGSTGID